MAPIDALDSIDRKILELLQSDARITNAEIARKIGIVPSETLDRIRKLEDRGVVRGYEARLDPKSIGLGLTAFVFVRATERPGEKATGERLAELPEVQEVHHVAGEDCYLVKVRAADAEALGAMLRERIGTIESVTATRTTIVLGTVKETIALPVPGTGGGGAGR